MNSFIDVEKFSKMSNEEQKRILDLLKILSNDFIKYHDNLPGKNPEFNESKHWEFIESIIKGEIKGNKELIISLKDGIPNGFCILEAIKDIETGRINEIYSIQNDFMNRISEIDEKTIKNINIIKNSKEAGIGSKLIEKAEEYFKDNGCKISELHVFKDNDMAKSFYEKHGYIITEEMIGKSGCETNAIKLIDKEINKDVLKSNYIIRLNPQWDFFIKNIKDKIEKGEITYDDIQKSGLLTKTDITMEEEEQLGKLLNSKEMANEYM